MKIFDLNRNQEMECLIVEVDGRDYAIISDSKEYIFDWQRELGRGVFKLSTVENDEVHGLLSISDFTEEFRVHINLLESSNANKGKTKKFENVTGCLIAIAVQVSFQKGYLGFTSLIPKTELIDLYINKYGFTQYGRQLAIEGREAINLITKYL